MMKPWISLCTKKGSEQRRATLTDLWRVQDAWTFDENVKRIACKEHIVALLWAANLMHGWTKQLDPVRTRWSHVTHYFFDDCASYMPTMSDPFYGSIAFRSLTDRDRPGCPQPRGRA